MAHKKTVTKPLSLREARATPARARATKRAPASAFEEAHAIANQRRAARVRAGQRARNRAAWAASKGAPPTLPGLPAVPPSLINKTKAQAKGRAGKRAQLPAFAPSPPGLYTATKRPTLVRKPGKRASPMPRKRTGKPAQAPRRYQRK
jgi:hypothetical protein